MPRPVLSLTLPVARRGNGRTRDGGPILPIIGQEASEKKNKEYHHRQETHPPWLRHALSGVPMKRQQLHKYLMETIRDKEGLEAEEAQSPGHGHGQRSARPQPSSWLPTFLHIAYLGQGGVRCFESTRVYEEGDPGRRDVSCIRFLPKCGGTAAGRRVLR